ncbi:MAG: DMT family transporter [Caldilineaceae bacterium]|nr:DMT family transporter [Caldilineaceae bacterium]MBP8107730.1 DMT family transporter [Caldilineaceae bacterium]MBP8122851.1 DMT family transporter [Caldilineaceae bacterium]MBP9071245.1 DMT family transporter [Caldilineaceae bacterium]
MTADERRGLVYVGIAVLFFSTSPVLIRWAAATLTAYEITAGRMAVAAFAVLGLALFQRHKLPPRQDWPKFALFGLVTALHFGFYIASLAYTSIAHSLAIIYTAPVFVAIFSLIFLKERLTVRQWVGIGVAVLGVGVLAGFEPHFTRRMLIGDLMALGSAITFGIYSVAGRSQRDRYPLFVYAGTVYAVAALWLIPPAAANFSPDGYTLAAVGSILFLGLFPLGLGHTLYNAALRRVSATYVNLIATQEVTGGIVLGILLLGEYPTINSVIGALVTLAGIVLVVI